jgi:transposase
VDTGYLDAELLARAWQDYRVDLLGPTRPDYKWQARAGKGFEAGRFQIDWERQQAICPAGRTSLSWTPAIDRVENEVVKIKFSMRDCGPCPSRAACTRAPRRTVTVRRQEHIFTATALNLVRIGQWLAGVPHTRTRQSSFIKLMAQPVA